MPDKEQFTFTDEDDFPESDLSAAFTEGEHAAEVEVPEEPEPQKRGKGNSRMRMPLLVLLLVVAGAAGAYYFMDLGGTTPAVPSVPVPAKQAPQSVALPPQPAKSPVAPAKPEPVAKPVTVPVPPPPAEKSSVTAPATAAPGKEVTAKPAPEKPAAVKPQAAPAAATKPVAEKPVAAPVKAVAAPQPTPAAPARAAGTATEKSAPAPQPAAVAPVAAAPQPAKPATASKQVAGGNFTLDGGSYLFESNRDMLVAKAKELGYEPLVTPIEATLDMTRLRLGTFGKDEVQKVLAEARAIEPGAYSAPAGENYVIYAGTFLQSRNIEQLTRRFEAEGFKVHAEPVKVVRTLSRIRFGSFATREEALVAAKAANEAGMDAEVVKFK